MYGHSFLSVCSREELALTSAAVHSARYKVINSERPPRIQACYIKYYFFILQHERSYSHLTLTLIYN
jgi:hypothetical protein